ncbi:branched-chain alpha-keto acid dehydrogenase [Lysinibacillus sp. PLM2]|nr:branched-chain alpha-keto acid dehydrogenase [Lysinibacillus sp. PLM2]
MVKVFVYGTLLKGEENAYYLNNATCIEEHCWIFARLFDTGYGYPAITLASNNRTYGELYEVSESDLPLLDELEDYIEGAPNNLYERVLQEIYTEKGIISAFVYIANQDGLLKREIPEGDWRKYRKLLE